MLITALIFNYATIKSYIVSVANFTYTWSILTFNIPLESHNLAENNCKRIMILSLYVLFLYMYENQRCHC